jgi:hypothetical protein
LCTKFRVNKRRLGANDFASRDAELSKKMKAFLLDITPKIPYILGAMFKREINPAKTNSAANPYPLF